MGEGSAPAASPRLQPLLHDLASCVAAPGVLLGALDGQLRPGGVSGWYLGDRRLLARCELSVAGSGLDLVRASTTGTARHAFAYVARSLGGVRSDPTVRIDRDRQLRPDGFTERLVVESVAQDPVEVALTMRLGTDLATMAQVKQGLDVAGVVARAIDDGLLWATADGDAMATGSPTPEVDAASGTLTWRLRLTRGERRGVELRVGTREPAGAAQFSPGGPAPWEVVVEAADLRVRRTVEQGLADLEGLLLAEDGDAFAAAGSPWFLTLFGRDSLWTARMLVPVDTGLALSTLRVLARRQGTAEDPRTEEQPGKILHEVRPTTLDLGRNVLPPLYYGSVDATPLFVCLLADVHEWGGDPDAVRALLPAARRCLEWVLEQSRDGGWLRYVDHTGTGLTHQGWKDSEDGVSFADGRLAEPPVALAEVQAYAYEAAVRGAALLAAYAAEPVPGLEDWARDLRVRFARDFWVETPEGGHAALALDRGDHRVDALTSNIGHLLGTGLLDEAATRRLGDLLVDPRLDSGFGLRTLATDSPRFSRLSYHGGTVWPHDTAIAVRGLAAEGRLEEAARLTRGLVVAAEGVGHRLPELYGGDAADEVDLPSAYPAACRPQAWAAAAPLAALVATTGVRVDADAGEVQHPERTSTTLGAFTLRGLRLGAHGFDVGVDAEGRVEVSLPPGSPLRVRAT